jgi:hypothetical protein
MNECHLPPAGAPGKTLRHDAGAYARCSYCRRYSLDPRTLSDRQPVCECGERHGWSGSFKPPGPDARWSGAAPCNPADSSTAEPCRSGDLSTAPRIEFAGSEPEELALPPPDFFVEDSAPIVGKGQTPAWFETKVHAYATSREEALRAEVERYRKGHERYEYLRTLAPVYYSDLWSRNINGEGSFDDLVDAAIKERSHG